MLDRMALGGRASALDYAVLEGKLEGPSEPDRPVALADVAGHRLGVTCGVMVPEPC